MKYEETCFECSIYNPNHNPNPIPRLGYSIQVVLVTNKNPKAKIHLAIFYGSPPPPPKSPLMPFILGFMKYLLLPRKKLHCRIIAVRRRREGGKPS